MTQPDPEKSSSLPSFQSDAEAYLEMLSDMGIEKGMDQRCKALYADARGILRGVAQGSITTGLSRLAEDLIQIAQHHPNANSFTKELEIVLEAAASTGMSVDGVQLSPAKPKRFNDRAR